MVPQDRMIQAIRRVAGLVRANVHSRVRPDEGQLAAISRLRGAVQLHGAETAVSIRRQLEGRLLTKLEPSSQRWNPMAVIPQLRHEPAWTRWISHILQLGDEAARAMWSALCAVAVEAHAAESHAGTGGAHAWVEPCAVETVKAWPELRIGGARTDIIVETPTQFAVIENKLYGGWNDGEEKQATTYASWAKRARGSKALGLLRVSIEPPSESETLEEGWRYVTWAQLALALRRQVRSALRAPMSADRAVEWAPIANTIAAIERTLLRLNPAVLHKAEPSWRELEMLARWQEHLEGHDDLV